MDHKEYFANLEGSEFVGELQNRITAFVSSRRHLEERWRRNYNFLYNNYFKKQDLISTITYGGEQGEVTQIPVNHFRNIQQHLVNMITSQPPSFNCRATNTDASSIAQAKLGNNLLEYYLKEKALSKVLVKSVERALAFDADYIMTCWDVSGGEEFAVDVNERPVREGDLSYINISSWDMVFDTTKTNFNDNDWLIIRTFKSKWDLISQYPEYADKIINVKNVNYRSNPRPMLNYNTADVDDIEVFVFLHKKTASKPNGRYAEFCGDDIILVDTDLPYRTIPVRQITAGDDLASQFGYSPLNDIAPIQEMINMEWSVVATNHENFGVQNVVCAKDSGVRTRSLIGGLNLIEFDASAGPAPAPLNLVQTPAEIFNTIALLERTMETLSGVNGVVRGNPESSLKSGTSLALVQNQALAFMNHLQSSYKTLIEDVGTDSINILRDFATSPRIVSICGKFNQASMQEFNGDDLQLINRVQVEMGNALSKTTAGRVELANNLLQNGLIKTPEEYLQVVETGNIEIMTEHTTSELQLIRNENDDLIEGRGARALVTDDHRLHILEHKTILASPKMRADEQLAGLVLSHMQEHIQLMQDPMVSQLQQVLGQMTLPPPQMQPPMNPAMLAPQGQMDNPGEMEVGPGIRNAKLPNLPKNAIPRTQPQQSNL